MNQDGRSSSLTAPNGPAQQEVLKAALADGGLSPAELTGLQLHGTGTALGDPIEVGAVLQAYYAADAAGSKLANKSSSRSRGSGSLQALYLFAAKATVGHAEPAAGITGLIYAAQQAAAAAALPIQHLSALNPYVTSAIDSAVPVGAVGGVMAMPRTSMPLQSLAGAERQGLLALGVSAFAFQGSNAHAIVTSTSLAAVDSSTGSDSYSKGSRGWSASSALPWSTSRVWVHPLACTLLTSVVKAAPERGVVFELELSVSHLAHTWDHVVAGGALVPGVLFMEMAASAVQQAIITSSNGGSSGAAGSLAGLANVTIPAACLLPELRSGNSKQQAVLLRCLVQQHMVQVASSSRVAGHVQHKVHLQAQPVAVSSVSTSTSSSPVMQLAGQRLLAAWLQPLPGCSLGEPSEACAAATATLAACDSKGHSASSGCAEPAQLDALLQLAAVHRGHIRPDLVAQLQVPAAAELYLSAAAASAGNHVNSVNSSVCMLATAAIRPGLSAEAMVADFQMAAAGGAGGSVCSIVGLRARKASAAGLVQQPATAGRSSTLASVEEGAEVNCATPGSKILYVTHVIQCSSQH
jgi:hypothetical protein